MMIKTNQKVLEAHQVLIHLRLQSLSLQEALVKLEELVKMQFQRLQFAKAPNNHNKITQTAWTKNICTTKTINKNSLMTSNL